MIGSVMRALDESVETELADARKDAERLMASTVAQYQLVAALELARDLRRTLGATLRPVSVTDVVSLKREA